MPARQERLEKAQAELDAWKQDPITKQFRSALRRWQEILKEQWAAGLFSSLKIEETALANHKAISEYQILDQVLEMDAERIEGILQHDNQE